MAYLYSKGKRVLGDIIGEDDSDGNTKIDFEEDRIDLQTAGNTRFKISGSQGQITFNEAYTFPYLDGNRDQVLATDGNGAVSWVDPAGGGGVELVVTGSSNLGLDSTYNGGTVIITPLSSDVTYTLPNPEPDFKVKFLAGSNLVGGDIIFRTKQNSQKIFGLLYRVSFGGDGDTGYDTSPASFVGAGVNQFIGGASEEQRNTITIENALQGSDIDFYSDGTYWYVRGTIVATQATSAAASVITFSSGSY